MQFLPKGYVPKRLLKKRQFWDKRVCVCLLIVVANLLVAFTPANNVEGSQETRVREAVRVDKLSLSANFLTYAHKIDPIRSPELSTDAPVADPWYVTDDEYTNNLGNAQTIANFCSGEWANAKAWLEANYIPGWPHGPVKDERSPIDLGKTIAVAIAANAMRESICIPSTSQGVGWVSGERSAVEVTDWLLSLGNAKGQAWGIIQWDGGRRHNFALFCKASAFDPRSLEAQLYYLAYEYYASSEYGSYRRLVSRYTSSDVSLENVKGAAEVFRVDVERGGTAHSADAILENWGNKWSTTWGDKPAGGLYKFLTEA